MIRTPGEPTMRADEDAPSSQRWWQLSLAQLGVVAAWGLGFYLLNHTPLGEPELWGHVAEGAWILERQVLPPVDPLVSLLGMPWIDTAWLSQVVFGCGAAWGGGEGLSLIFAVTMLAAYLTLARTFYLQTSHVWAAHLGVLAVVAVGWSRTATARPEMFGTLCFAILLWLLVRDRVADSRATAQGRVRWGLWLGIPPLMMLWANLHSSFACGLLVLACWLLGVIAETAWRERSLPAVIADRAVRRWVWLCELAVAATCLNPYGARLPLYQLWFADYEQLRELADWRRLVLLDAGGRELAASLAVLMLVLRFSRRRIPVADVLLIAAFSIALGSGLRMAWWYAAVFGVVVTPHLADLGLRVWSFVPRWRRVTARTSREAGLDLPQGRSWSYSLVALGLLWIAFSVAPAGPWLMSRTLRPPAQLVSAVTPWQLSEFLRENPPPGQVFNPDWWGDWLTWDGPPGLRVFMTSQMHLAPRAVWIDYRIVRENRAGWDHILDRYGVQTVILDKQRQKTLTGYLRDSSNWRLLYEDQLGLVFGRVPHDPTPGKPSEKA